MTLTRALRRRAVIKRVRKISEEADEIMEMAFKLEGLVRNVGQHAGGVVIAPTKITDFSPTLLRRNRRWSDDPVRHERR